MTWHFTPILAQLSIPPEMIEALRTSDTVQILQVVVVLLALAVVLGLPAAAYFGLRMLGQMSKQTDKYDGLKASIDEGNRTATVSAASLQRLTEQNEIRHTQAQSTDDRVLKIMENQTVGITALTAAITGLDARSNLLLQGVDRLDQTIKHNGDELGQTMNDRLTPIEERLTRVEEMMGEALKLLHQLADPKAPEAPAGEPTLHIKAEVAVTPDTPASATEE